MSVERQETVGDIDVVFRELTVSEIREWMAGAAIEGVPQDIVGALLFDDFDLSDITLLTTLSADQLSAMAPSKIEEVFARCKAHNPRFFAMRARLAKIGMDTLASPPKTS